jgi:hypothetical protein
MSSKPESESPLDLSRQSPEIKEISLDRVLTIVSGPFARPIDNNLLLDMALGYGLPAQQIPAARQMIEATGFTRRYAYRNPDNPPDLEAAVDRTASIGALLLRRVMNARKWDDIDVLIDTSGFLPSSLNSRVLEKAGINPCEVNQRSYRYACAGAAGAFIDCLADPQLTDKRVVIAALEPLSYLIHKQHFSTLEGLPIAAIFGDDYAAVGFTPDNFELMAKEISVQPDGGVIKIRTEYDFDRAGHNPQTIPGHYTFKNGGESIFRHSDKGAFLNILSPQEGVPTMNGVETGRFFGDHTARLMLSLLENASRPDLLFELGRENIVMHLASAPVIHRIARELKKAGALPARELPWIMDQIGRSNSSSATILVNWQHLIERGLINPDKPIFLAAPGVGSVIAGAIVKTRS